MRDAEEIMINYELPYASRRVPVLADNMVATSQPLAAQAGIRMLLNGGNAVDAAVATAITLAVVEPTSNGIGSDAFAMVWDGRRLHGINGSGRSPAAWSFERFAQRSAMPETGWDAVTVPGAVSVWTELWARFGSLPFNRLFDPAIHYARHGYGVSPITAEKWREAAQPFSDFPNFCATFLPHGRAPVPGECFKCADMADTLEEIAATKGESFYRGDLARAIVRCAEAEGGVLSLADLADHKPLWVTPLAYDYRGYTVHEMPPNGQGIAALIAMGILAHFDLARYPVDSADSIHLQAEAMKLAFAEVAAHLADDDAMRVDCSKLLDPSYIRQRATCLNMDKAGNPETGIPAGGGTVYLSTADASGMMVSFIQSNYKGFGSGVVVPGTGISLQNRGLGFTLEPGHVNRVAGGKRPFHTIIPAFVTKNGRPLLSFGVMGAHMQAQGHVQMLTRILDYRQNPQAASDAPRWHVMPDGSLALENGFPKNVIESLSSRGHRILLGESMHLFGGAQLILRNEDRYLGASDHRKDGLAVGF